MKVEVYLDTVCFKDAIMTVLHFGSNPVSVCFSVCTSQDRMKQMEQFPLLN